MSWLVLFPCAERTRSSFLGRDIAVVKLPKHECGNPEPVWPCTWLGLVCGMLLEGSGVSSSSLQDKGAGAEWEGAAHLEGRELHIWNIQYFLKVTATLPLGQEPRARCTAQLTRIHFERKAKISLSAESQPPGTSSMGAEGLHGEPELPAGHCGSCGGSCWQPRQRESSQLGNEHRDGDPGDLSGKTVSFCQHKEPRPSPMALPHILARAGWLCEGASTDGTVPAEGRGASWMSPPVPSVRDRRTRKKPPPFQQRGVSSARTGHPSAAHIPPAAGSMKSWPMGTSSDQPSAGDPVPPRGWGLQPGRAGGGCLPSLRPRRKRHSAFIPAVPRRDPPETQPLPAPEAGNYPC